MTPSVVNTAWAPRYVRVAGDDITLKMPVGTIITDAETGEVLFELLTPGEVITIAKGGDGGFGNMRFKSAITGAPAKNARLAR